MKMNPRIKKLWVAALRSGKYKQGKYRLRRGQGENTAFCCLGVLCNLHAMEHPDVAARQRTPHAYMGLGAMPPVAVWKWAKLDRFTELKIGRRMETLDVHNDEGASFKEIADAIERQL